MKVKDIYIFGKYTKKMSLCNKAEKEYICDNFAINLENNIGINAIAHISEEGFYFKILAVYNNGKIYRNNRYFTKYVTLIRDSIFNYYNSKKMIPWYEYK